MALEPSHAFAPGRVNLIGEHTDYNDGLALPFAIAAGITVSAAPQGARAAAAAEVEVFARDLGEHDRFELAAPPPVSGWRAFARGIVAELAAAGFPLVAAEIEIGGELPRGAGLSSSAALEVALCLAMIDLGAPAHARIDTLDRIALARLCARVENDWVGAQTGLLDQLACLCGAKETALCIDFSTLAVDPVPLRLGDWRLVLLDSGERHELASSGYNERRSECARACQLLGIGSLRTAGVQELERLPEPLRSRARHVLGENERVRAAVAALRAEDLRSIGGLLDASHSSLRDNYDVSTPAVERTVERLKRAGARGARLVGGGFGGSVLGLFAPGSQPPEGAYEVRPCAGAHLVAP